MWASIKKGILAVIEWVASIFSEVGTTSSKRVGYIAGIVAAIVWLSTSLHHSGLTELWILAFQSFLASCTGGYVLGKFADKNSSSSVSSAPTADDNDAADVVK